MNILWGIWRLGAVVYLIRVLLRRELFKGSPLMLLILYIYAFLASLVWPIILYAEIRCNREAKKW